jgi:hypothetical protein
MMNPRSFVPLVALAAGLAAQTTVVFPAEYTAVAEGPLNSPNLPLAFGTSRVLVVYDRQDVTVPDGASITQIGFRQDTAVTTLDTGRSLQLEVRMGYTTASSSAPSTTFDTNYDGAPATVFGPALFQLPNLRDTASPLPNGQLFVTLTTPFVFVPAGRNLVVEYRINGNSGGGTSFNYRLDRADFFSPVLLGAPGCATSGNVVPQLTANPVRTGQTLTLTGSTGPANSFGVVAIDVGGRLVTPFPLGAVFGGIAPACTGQLLPANLATLGAATSTNGGFTASYTIPNVPALNDLWVAHQALLLDAFAPGSLVVSNGVEVQIGIKPRSSIVAAQGLPSQLTTGTLNANYCPVAFFTWQ